MPDLYTEGEIFQKLNFSKQLFSKGEYENCTFWQCDFSESTLSESRFSDCIFNECNLSLSNLNKTAFQGVVFKNCKLIGLHFDHCSDFGFSVRFEHCVLNHSLFYKKKLKKTYFINCKIQEADFAECDLSNACFENSDLLGTLFENTNLEKADFRGAVNFSINPETNRMKKARFNALGLIGLLNKYDLEVE